MNEILLEHQGPVARLTLNRPQSRNALNPGLMAELADAVAGLLRDESRVIVLTGAGDVFSAGADLQWMRESHELSERHNVEDTARMRALFEAIDSCPKPVVARVNGHAMGGGAGLIACADVAIAVETARFAFSEARLGLIPAIISPYVLRRIGPGHTRALFTTASAFGAREARSLGLVHRVVEVDELDSTVDEVVQDLLTCGPVAIAECKRLVREATASLALDDLPERIAAVRAGAEGQEGVDAFLHKRRPRWLPPSDAS